MNRSSVQNAFELVTWLIKWKQKYKSSLLKSTEVWITTNGITKRRNPYVTFITENFLGGKEKQEVNNLKQGRVVLVALEKSGYATVS